MRRIPGYLIIALCGVLLIAFSVLTIFTADAQSPQHPLVPTVMAMLTQMPPQAVATQLAQMGYIVPPAMMATAQAMLQQMPPQAVFETLVAGIGGPPPTPVPPTPVSQSPAQPTAAPPVIEPPAAQTPQPAAPLPVQPSPESPGQPPAQPVPETTAQPPTPAPVGRISGSVRRAELPDSGGINLVLTRPDGTTLNIPAGAEGLFNFAGMEPGNYTLEARAGGFLSAWTAFTLEAGQDLILPPAVLLAGDTNGDNIVDLTDAVMLAANFNAPPPVPEADLNRDGWIDIRDLAILGSAFGLAGPLAWE